MEAWRPLRQVRVHPLTVDGAVPVLSFCELPSDNPILSGGHGRCPVGPGSNPLSAVPPQIFSECTIRVVVGHVTQDISGRPEMQNRNCQPLVYGGKNHCRREPHDSQNQHASAVSRPRNRARGKETPPRISRI